MDAPQKSLPVLCGALAASILAAWTVGRLEVSPQASSAASPRETRRVLEEHFPDGRIHVRRWVVDTADGQTVNDGEMTVWHPSGQLRSRGTWQQGKKHGRFEHWHASGASAKLVHYDSGLADGPFFDWDDEGRLLRRETWRQGRRVAE